MGAAAAKCRSLAQVISTKEMAVGDTNVPFFVEDGSGNWEAGLYTITSSTFITRTTILNSSSGGSAVTFDGGNLTVFNSAPAADLNAGLVNSHDPGFDIILLIGQSNMVGMDAPTTALDITDSRVFTFGGFSNEASTYRKITQAVDPLRHNLNPAAYASMPTPGNGAGLGPGSWLARTYAGMIPSNRRVLLVPVARSATKLFADTREWFPGDGTQGSGTALGATGSVLLDNAISQATLALTAAQQLYPKSRFVGTAMHQGESDADYYGLNLQLNYMSALKTLIQAIRTRIPGAANSWFVIGGLMGENVADTTGHPGYQSVDNAHRNVATEVPHVAYTPGLTGYNLGDNLHYSAAGARVLGCNMASVIPAAIQSQGVDTTAPVTRAAIVYATDASTIAWSVSEPVDPNYVPAASAFTLAGHTATGVRIQGNYIYVSVTPAFVYGEAARTLTYTAPGTNGLRDFAGNQMTSTTQSIGNNVPSAPTVSSVTVSPSTPSVSGGATQQFTATVTGTGSPAQTVTWTTTAGTVDSSGLFTAPAATGSAQTITVTATSTVDNTKSGTATVTVGASGGGAATVSSVTVSPPTANVSGGGTQQFTATVSGTNSPAQTVTWAVTAGVGTINSSGLYTAPAATSGAQSATITATSTVDNTKSGTASVTVPAIGAATDIRFDSLVNMNETSTVAPYSYAVVNYAAISTTVEGGVSVLGMAGDGTFTVKINYTSSTRNMVGFRTTRTVGAYNTNQFNIQAGTNYGIFVGTGNLTVTRAPVDGDLIKLERTGTTVQVYISSNNGTLYQQIAQLTGVATGTLYVQIMGQTSATFTAPQGTGFA
jgi:hypothetical protein